MFYGYSKFNEIQNEFNEMILLQRNFADLSDLFHVHSTVLTSLFSMVSVKSVVNFNKYISLSQRHRCTPVMEMQLHKTDSATVT